MKEECRIIIAGGRDFNNYGLLEEAVNRVISKLITYDVIFSPFDIVIVSGCAVGADQLGMRFAENYKHRVALFPADWEKYGRSAGPIRNAEMAKYAVADDCYGVLVAFWDGESKGTKNMIDVARRYGLEINVVGYKKEESDERRRD